MPRINYVYDFLKNGVSLILSKDKTRTYKFLAYTNSSFKDIQFWFILSDRNVDKLINPMADFDTEKKLLKRQARIGQMFTTSNFV